jgi:hypothetical protein
MNFAYSPIAIAVAERRERDWPDTGEISQLEFVDRQVIDFESGATVKVLRDALSKLPSLKTERRPLIARPSLSSVTLTTARPVDTGSSRS